MYRNQGLSGTFALDKLPGRIVFLLPGSVRYGSGLKMQQHLATTTLLVACLTSTSTAFHPPPISIFPSSSIPSRSLYPASGSDKNLGFPSSLHRSSPSYAALSFASNQDPRRQYSRRPSRKDDNSQQERPIQGALPQVE